MKILTDQFDVFAGKYEKLQSRISQLYHKPRKKRFQQCSIYKKRNAGDKSCSSSSKQC